MLIKSYFSVVIALFICRSELLLVQSAAPRTSALSAEEGPSDLNLRGKSSIAATSSIKNYQFKQGRAVVRPRELTKDKNSTGCTNHWCHANARCVPKADPVPENEHPYDCICDEADGWTGDGWQTCSDYDECAYAYPCVPKEEGGFCQDRDPNMSPPKYLCGCRSGFVEGSNPNIHGATECVNVNECLVGSNKCHAKATCVDTVGSYYCQCASNFVGDGRHCRLAADDLDIRFSKITFADVVPADATLPLTSINYPMDNSTFSWLRYSEAHSVTIKEVCEECDTPFEELIAAIGGAPTHPSSDANSDYWKELEHVVDVQILRRANITPDAMMPLPTLWKGKTVSDVADAVHNEYPGIHHVALIQAMGGLTIDNTVIPFIVKIEFVRRIVMVADLVTWAIARVAPPNFGLKWCVGRVRPETMAFKISQGEYASIVPHELKTKIAYLQLTTPESFTAYPEGSPPHPAWPAMHSAGSAASLWMAVVLELTDTEWCEVKLTDYAVSYGRTVAGVHYVSDNIAGLNLGQEIVARRLPQYLHEKYSSDVAAVEAKIATKRFDWKDFETSDCYKQSMGQ